MSWGTGGGGEHEGIEESGDIEVMSTEGERPRREDSWDVAGDGESSRGATVIGGGGGKTK